MTPTRKQMLEEVFEALEYWLPLVMPLEGIGRSDLLVAKRQDSWTAAKNALSHREALMALVEPKPLEKFQKIWDNHRHKYMTRMCHFEFQEILIRVLEAAGVPYVD